MIFFIIKSSTITLSRMQIISMKKYIYLLTLHSSIMKGARRPSPPSHSQEALEI